MDVKRLATKEWWVTGVLPPEMLYEILWRLPLKTLLRCKCVCKQWRSIIRDLAYRARGSQSPMALISFMKKESGDYLFFRLDLGTGLARPIDMLNEPPFTEGIVTHSLNDLICFELDSLTYLCNPSTEEITSLPCDHGAEDMSLSSLGFDPEKREYKILKTTCEAIGQGEEGFYHKIIKLGAGVWTDIGGGPREYRHGGSICLSGVIYYLAYDLSLKEYIGAFDVTLERFHKMSLPDAIASFWDTLYLVLFRGHLALLNSARLKDEDVIMVYELVDCLAQSWEEHRIVLPPRWRGDQDSCTFRLTVISTEEILLAPRNSSTRQFYVLLYNMKTNKLRRLEISGLPEAQLSSPIVIGHGPVEYTERILSLN